MNNYMKTIISGLQSYIHSYAKKARGNWNQNNPDAIDYIKNRPFYSETENVVLFEKSSITDFDFGNENVVAIQGNGNINFLPNIEYSINYNGNNYTCKLQSIESQINGFGDVGLLVEGVITNNSFPFAFVQNAEYNLWRLAFVRADVETYSFKITGPKETIVKIPEKYLPFSNSNILNGTGEGAVRTKYASEALGDFSFAEGDSTRANGPASHAEGYRTRANGPASHAEGYDTGANGNFSHAEGRNTGANGQASHAEGYNTRANGEYSHAEGSSTEAIGHYSHAEGGYTITNGEYSHVEGYGTIANGEYSHAEGYETITNGKYSHAEGKGVTGMVKISGAPNSTTYKLNSYQGGFDIGSVLTYNDTYYEENAVYSIVTNIDFENYTIEVDKTLSSTETFNGHYIHFYQGANGEYSHVEGYGAIANGPASHAEGYQTRANGRASHTEGESTRANGEHSHAEGYNTIANGKCQHVQGRYNIEDIENKYAHIIGNGDWNDPVNIHTIDWHGNAWFSGDVRIGGKNYENGKKIHRSMTEVVLEPSKWNNNEQTVFVEGISSNNLKQFIQIIPNENDQENLKIIKKCEIKAVEQVENGIVFSSSIIPVSEVSFYVVWEDIDWIGAAPGLTGLIDFNYEENEDGTYTLTSWKGTFNGESSTEIRIPNDPRVIF